MIKQKSLVTLTTNRSTKFSDSLSSDGTDIIKPSTAVNPTPTEFDQFIPWVCAQWCASTNVIITRLNQETYVKYDPKKSGQMIRKVKKKSVMPVEPQAHMPSGSVQVLDVMNDKILLIDAIYNNKRKLVEVSIVGSPYKISRRVIQAFSLCITYHSSLTRLTIRKGGLSHLIIYEIKKLLPLSNITELCFDDSIVAEANYFILLEDVSQLKYFSLNRCRLDDDVCIKIAQALDHGNAASNSLQVLEMASNGITDVGAIALGAMLRRNRCLLHLNISGNKITDTGFQAIMNSLKMFPLTYEETLSMRHRKMRYFQNKTAVYERCMEDLKHGRPDDAESYTSGKKMYARRSRRKSRRDAPIDNIYTQAEVMTKGIVGDFKDAFGPDNIEIRNGIIYSKGNFTLCSLNIAFNNLEFSSILTVSEVLSYQSYEDKYPPETGLIRITLDGNNIPATCNELYEIDTLLRKIILQYFPSPRKTRTSSLIRKMIAAKNSNV